MIDGSEYVIKPGTTGVEKNHIQYFFDTNRYAAVGFERGFCLENPQMFQVSKTLNDKEVPVSEVLKVVEEMQLPIDKRVLTALVMRIKSL